MPKVTKIQYRRLNDGAKLAFHPHGLVKPGTFLDEVPKSLLSRFEEIYTEVEVPDVVEAASTPAFDASWPLSDDAEDTDDSAGMGSADASLDAGLEAASGLKSSEEPWEGYNLSSVNQIMKRLDGMPSADWHAVLTFESANRNRSKIVSRITRELGI